LYFDFSGYSDMALGLAAMFGIQLPENFDRPYTSRSITEFWRRWHMSLSRWFRDYLYIPLGGNRSSRATTYRNLIIVFLATGIWHGANWTFLVWGAYHGTLLLIERVRGVGARSDLGWQSQAGTLTLVMLGWIIFRSPDIAHAVGYLAALVRPLGGIAPDILVTLNPLAVIGLALGIASFFLPRTWVTGRRIASDPSRRSEALRIGSVVVAVPVALILLVAGGFSPFLYFQF
jgi:alginate O-acetyltransferase complex protein AlgI